MTARAKAGADYLGLVLPLAGLALGIWYLVG